MNKNITCIKCGKKLTGKQTMYCSSVCKNNYLQSYHAQQIRGKKRKIELIQRFGGKCMICGYHKNTAALTFHHLHPDQKSFALDLRSLSNRKNSAIDQEVQKCILVCHNCHAEIHNPQHNLE